MPGDPHEPNYRKLRVFHDSHALAAAIYKHTRGFPRDEWFGLRSQMRRAAVSVPCNIVEGNARGSTRDYLRFLHTPLGSSSELQYLVTLATELGFGSGQDWTTVQSQSEVVARQLQRLVERMESMAASEVRASRRQSA
jgi:four helix bundle protein